MSDKVNQVRTFEVLTATPSRRSPRHWSDDEKARLVAEAFSPGGTENGGAKFGHGSGGIVLPRAA